MIFNAKNEIYEEAEEETPKYEFLDSEIDSIMRQAFTGKKDYSYDRKKISSADSRVTLRFKRYNSMDVGTESPTSSQSTLNFANEEISIPVSSLDFSLDMLLSEIIKNEVALLALGINADRNGRITTSLKRYAYFDYLVQSSLARL